MDGEHYEDNVQSNSPGKLYYAGFVTFIAASFILAVWAFVMLALAK